MVEEVKYLRIELENSKVEVNCLKTENERLKQVVNLTLYKVDEIEQYGRRENIRIHGIKESLTKEDDGETIINEMSKDLNIELTLNDIQRAHRLGKKSFSENARPRPIIVRFSSFKKRNEFMFSKSKLKNLSKYNNVFITEDLTALRLKLFHYVKEAGKGKYVQFHTMNGKIRMKKSERAAGKQLAPDERDQGTGSWLYINSPDDLFKFNIDVNFEKIGYSQLYFNRSNYNNEARS